MVVEVDSTMSCIECKNYEPKYGRVIEDGTNIVGRIVNTDSGVSFKKAGTGVDILLNGENIGYLLHSGGLPKGVTVR